MVGTPALAGFNMMQKNSADMHGPGPLRGTGGLVYPKEKAERLETAGTEAGEAGEPM